MQNQGITILQIVIAIVIMIILASVAILYGGGIPREANIASVYSEIREIKGAFQEARMLNRLKVSGDKLIIFNEIAVPHISASEYQDVLGAEATGEYYYLDFTSSKELRNVLDAENIKNDYILDFNNLNIYMVKGVNIISGEESSMQHNAENIEYYYKNMYQK